MRRRKIPGGVGLVPFFALVIFFLGWPLVSVVIRSFHDNDGHLTVANFRAITHKPYSTAFYTSIKLALLTALIGSICGAMVSYLIVRTARPLVQRVLDSITAVLANSGGVPLTFMFIAAFGAEGRVIKLLKSAGLDLYGQQRWTLFSFSGVAMVYCFFQIPLMVIVFNPAVRGLRKEWDEASRSLGAGPLRYWSKVAIPILMPSFLGAFFLLFANGFSAYATARAMTSGTTPLVPLLIGNLVDGNVIVNEAHLGDALAVGMIVVAAIAMLGYGLAQNRVARWRKS